MNSYPIELLVAHVPLMFVAGLDVPPGERDPFRSLIIRLREVLTSRPKGLVWDKNRASAFNILLVEKNLRFPPRKIVSPENPSIPPHSPLSPLVPTSPLYPDGLIAPVWVRKHVELIPSIYVLFLRLWESPPPLSPLEGREKELEEERSHDQELANELASRKRALAERGIKLTAVLLASRRLLDDPGLDARLTYLRRQSSLDARAALFVLSPVSNNELQEFVKSLTEALREPSLEYYTAHSKRVRRKRNKHSSSAYSGYPTSIVATSRSVPLRPIGWTVRYEYKLATFAEFRFEEEVARKHYEDCWNALSEMFGSTSVLPPRTKRWAEAKVLADCVAIKIYKFYLYYNEHNLALAFFNKHVNRFCALSRTWGIGEDTFEYWSWLARQYRILAELLEIALRGGLRLPRTTPQSAEDRPATLPTDTPETLGLNPSTVLQHPGFYYFKAAAATQERLKRFKIIEDAETIQPSAISGSPAFNNEKKVDHWDIILELYSKAYEQFKRFSAGHSRLTFFVAVQIATSYHASGKHDLAVKFFERIVKVYHKERWGPMLKPLLSLWYESAKQLENIEMCIRLVFERMALGTSAENDILSQDLLGILMTTKPSSTSEPFGVELSSVEPILPSSVVFYESETPISVSTPFQLHLQIPSTTGLHLLPLAYIVLRFSDDRPPIVIHRTGNLPEGRSHILLGDLGSETDAPPELSREIDLTPGSTRVLTGFLTSTVPAELTISGIAIAFQKEDWIVEVNFEPAIASASEIQWIHNLETSPRLIKLYRSDISTVRFQSSPHEFKVLVHHAGKALIGEEYPIEVVIESQDDRELEVTFDVLLQPAENDTIHYISAGEERSTSFLRGLRFNRTLPPSGQVSRTVFLNAGGPGKRVLDISFRSMIPGSAVSDTGDEGSELLHTISVEAVDPFFHASHVHYTQPNHGLPNAPTWDTQTYQRHVAEANIVTLIRCSSDCDLEILEIKFTSVDNSKAFMISSSLGTDEDCLRWAPGDAFSADVRIGIHDPSNFDEYAIEPAIASPVRLDVKWRRAGIVHANVPVTTTAIMLPELTPPHVGLTIVIDPPAQVVLHRPFMLSAIVRNNDPLRSADLTFTLEPSDGFVIAGLRSGALPLLLPGTESTVSFSLIPLTTGIIKLPIFKVQRLVAEDPSNPHRSESELATRTGIASEVVPVVDGRWNLMDKAGNNIYFYSSDGQALAGIDLSQWLAVTVVAW